MRLARTGDFAAMAAAARESINGGSSLAAAGAAISKAALMIANRRIAVPLLPGRHDRLGAQLLLGARPMDPLHLGKTSALPASPGDARLDYVPNPRTGATMSCGSRPRNSPLCARLPDSPTSLIW